MTLKPTSPRPPRGTKNEKDSGAKNNNNEKYIANRDIPQGNVYVISPEGKNLGLLERDSALKLATESGLDLLVVGMREGLPITKILNLSKELYERKKKEKYAKKNQHEIEVKELRITPRIGLHDLEIKTKKAVSVIMGGDRVKFVLFLKGREKSLKDPGAEVFLKIEEFINAGIAASGRQLVIEQGMEKGMRTSRLMYLKK